MNKIVELHTVHQALLFWKATMDENEFDPILLEKIESEIVPLLEKLAEQAIEQAKSRPAQLVPAPVPFIIDDDVMFNEGEFIHFS